MDDPPLAWRFVCPACESAWEPGSAPLPAGALCCPNAGRDDGDHLPRRVLVTQEEELLAVARAAFLDDDPRPFARYRRLLASYTSARRQGLSDTAYVEIIERLGREVEAIDGQALAVSPCSRQDRLSDVLGSSSSAGIWVKDETHQPAGSHKVRHLFGILLWLVIDKASHAPADSARSADRPRLAIASCGNAARSAAVLARAARRPLDVFVPVDIRPETREELEALGAGLTLCPRPAVGSGDPCVRALETAVRGGAVPFTVQGDRNALAIEGGMTLGYEIVSACRREGWWPDRLFVQVGGGALASALVQAFEDAARLGLIDRPPTIHAVQTAACHPLERAHRHLSIRILDEAGDAAKSEPGAATNEAAWRRARQITATISPQALEEAMHRAVRHRSRFMWPWESPAASVAGGILDDETYDGMAVIRAMLMTGGWPILVSEERLLETRELVSSHTSIRTSPTGAAGLAGALELASGGRLDPNEKILVIFTGAPGT